MSHEESHTLRCRRWLKDQLESLAGLRNANPRDTAFKAWRQATMTVIQRIWPDQAARVERFRRIAFRAPGARPEPALIRDWHSRGCEQAHAYLAQLIEDVERNGAPEPLARTPDAARTGAPAEDDFPVVDLPSGDVRAARVPDTSHDDDNVIDLGGPAGPLAPAQGLVDDHGVPAPPKLRIDVPVARASASEDAAPLAAPPQLPALTPAPIAATPEPAHEIAPVPMRSGPPPAIQARPAKAGKKHSVGARLKDMLGFSKGDAANAADEPDHTPEAPREIVPALEVTPSTTPIEPATSSRPSAAEPEPAPAPAAAPLPPSETGEEGPRTSANSVFATGPRPLKKKPRRVESMDSLVPESLRAKAPEPEAPPAAVSAPAPAPEAAESPQAEVAESSVDHALDADTFERAASEFLMSSPVLGLTGRPVQRMSDATTFLEPDAVAIASLASDVGRLGVGEGARASVRAMLLDLARRVDGADVEWALLRDAVALAMEHPEVARRLMPILLPWLDRAA